MKHAQIDEMEGCDGIISEDYVITLMPFVYTLLENA
jgi:hypothetical protein